MKKENPVRKRQKATATRSTLIMLFKLAIVVLFIGMRSSAAQVAPAGQNPMVKGAEISSQRADGPEVSESEHQCTGPAIATSGSYKFRRQAEIFEIPLSSGECQAIALELRWSNGRNNGSNFHVTFLDSNSQPIYSKEISGFLSGSYFFPFATLETQPSLAPGSMMSVTAVPATVVIETVRPFAFPANISYTLTRSGSRQHTHARVETTGSATTGKAERPKTESADSATSTVGKKP